MSESRTVLERLWEAKGRLARVPGAYDAYRFATKKLGEGQLYTLRVGPLRGMKWRRYNALPYWYHLGMWEPHTSALIESHLRPGDVFWDIGANAGYFSLLASRVVGPSGFVVAVEADPNVGRILTEEMTVNGVAHYQLLDAAVAGESGEVTFMRMANSMLSSLASQVSGGESFTVRGITLDEMLQEHPRPDVIKMDIEGAEVEALQKADALLDPARGHRPRWLLSTHSEDGKAWCRQYLLDRGYTESIVPGFEQMILAIPSEQLQR